MKDNIKYNAKKCVKYYAKKYIVKYNAEKYIHLYKSYVRNIVFV